MVPDIDDLDQKGAPKVVGKPGLLDSPWIHPLLFTLFPVAFLFSRNIAEAHLIDAWRSLLTVIVLELVLLLIYRLIWRSFPKAAVMTSLTMVLFLSYGHFVNLLGYEPHHWMDLGLTDLDPRLFIAALAIIVFALVVILLIRTRSSLQKLTRFLNMLAAVLVAAQVGMALYGSTTDGNALNEALADGLNLTMPPNPPDIYFICADAYGRSDILRQIYNFDNRPFLTHLRTWGFDIAEYSNSNYCQTLLSLPATLNLNYVSNLGSFDERSNNRKPLADLFQHNLIFGELKKLGYRIVAFESGFAATNFRDADVLRSYGFVLNEFENNLLGVTPVPLMAEKLLPQFAVHHRLVESTLDGLSEVEIGEQPVMVFAHIGAPHPPFVFREDGELVVPDRVFNFADGNHYLGFGGTTEGYIKGYHDQVSYLTRRLRETIDRILSRYPDQKPIIILQADHGPGSGLNWQNPYKTNLAERFGILNACLLPGIDTTLFYDQITPVNTFRLIMDAYFGANFERLPDNSFFSAWTRPYRFMDVTPVVYRASPSVVPDSSRPR